MRRCPHIAITPELFHFHLLQSLVIHSIRLGHLYLINNSDCRNDSGIIINTKN